MVRHNLPASWYFVLIIPHQKVLFCHVYFCMKTWKTTQYSLSKIFFVCLFCFVVFCWFCFLLLSNNTIHVMFSTSICYWNTFQYKYITQITFHVVKQSHAQVTPKYICLLFTLFVTFSVLSQLCFILWSSPPPLLFNWPRVQLY